MRELVESDSGKYFCGYLDDRRTVHYSDIVLLKVTDSLVQGSMMVRQAGVRETVIMECPHAQKWGNIVWCKASSLEVCNIIVETVAYQDKGRTSIKRQNGSVFVTMRELVKSDSGIYICGYLDVQHSVHRSDIVLLTVTTDSLVQGSMMVRQAGVRETVIMECPHAQKRGNIVWCKASSPKACNIIVETVAYQDKGRTSIKRQNGSVFVTMRELVKSDSGIYICGYLDVQHSVHHSDIVLLTVTTAGSWTADNTTVKGVMQNATSLHCHYEQQFKSHEKFLCKVTSVNWCSVIASSKYGSRNLTNIINNSTDFTVTIKQTNEGDKGEYWCGATDTVKFEIVQIKILEIFEATIKTPEVSKDRKSGPQIWYILVPLLLGLLVLLLIALLIKKRRRPLKTVTPAIFFSFADNNMNPETSITAKFEKEAEDTVTYSTITIQPSTQTEGSSAIYSNTKDLKEQNGDVKIHSSESVEYSTLLFRS
ncbi:polymeric immunoglobulin receptor-like isoform X2 [Hemitrygon akajei]|uniref:polymeric immunoglobulin receptor-like isoform X2 n=1 Tax=Hemitrygon akajei TaxID=2704970 RepID=UPI003BF9E414